MKKNIVLIVGVILMSLLFSGCDPYADMDASEMRITNVRIYRDTEAWELAQAVYKEDINAIKRIAREQPELLNYKEPTYGCPLIIWAVGREKYNSLEALLEMGADPNITYENGKTALLEAAGYSWVDNDAKQDAKYVKLLLQYGADPNKEFKTDPTQDPYGYGSTTPLIRSIRCGIEKTKALVEAGADINAKTETGVTAAAIAIRLGNTSTVEGPEYAHYLIVEKGADITIPEQGSSVDKYGNEQPKQYYPVEYLRRWVFPLDSDRHQLKMEIVEAFAKQGVDYWSTPIPDRILEQIKKLYPDSWEEYILKY